MIRLICVSLAFALTLPAAELAADSTRGAQVFTDQGCSSCHSVNGVGPRVGPDLGLVAERGFTPASLAATMWNHAPAMWVESKLRSFAQPVMSEQQAVDLLAFFYSLRFFEEPGDASRGKTLFSEKKCSACHGIDTVKAGSMALPVKNWTVPSDQLALVEIMWNHSSTMRGEMARNNVALAKITGQNLADLLVFVRSTQGKARRSDVFQTISAEGGAALFQSKGCAGCHGTSTHFLTIGLRNETLTDIAADMWNHGSDMSLRNTTFEAGQMGSIAAYIWSRRMIENYGRTNAGAKVFENKKCGACHDDPLSGAPPLTTGRLQFTGATMLSLLTRHGPAMLARMKEKNLAWPRFSGDEMADLIGYLNTRTAPNAR